MIDFTLKVYSEYLNIIKDQFDNIIRFEDYFLWGQKLDCFCIIRHDVDRKPKKALEMAKLEHSLGVCSTYYFRIKNRVFDKNIIRKIYRLGHEIGYHYESLSDNKGDYGLALADFEKNLTKLRKIVKVSTISMHGRPLSPYDSRDMWKNSYNHNLLKKKFHIKGEVYLDIDYSDIAYINDTGRNWLNNIANIRDYVFSNINFNFYNQKDLIDYFYKPHPKLILLIHPERWHDGFLGYSLQLFEDKFVNTIKLFLKRDMYYRNGNSIHK